MVKRFLYVLLALIFVCFLLLSGCSGNSEPIFIIKVEPSHININNVPPYITVTVEAKNKDEEWIIPGIDTPLVIPGRIVVERYENENWINVYDSGEYGFGRTLFVELYEPQMWIVPTHISPYHPYHYFDASVAGRYRAVFRNVWYVEFTISDGLDSPVP